MRRVSRWPQTRERGRRISKEQTESWKHGRRLAALLEDVFGDGDGRYALPAKRSPASAHLAGFDASKAPRFRWPDRLAGPGEAARDSASAPAFATALTALEPNARPAWRSVGGGEPTKIVLRNSTGRTVQVDWMDFEGRPKTYFTLRPGGQAESATYAGHIWRVGDSRRRRESPGCSPRRRYSSAGS